MDISSRGQALIHNQRVPAFTSQSPGCPSLTIAPSSVGEELMLKTWFWKEPSRDGAVRPRKRIFPGRLKTWQAILPDSRKYFHMDRITANFTLEGNLPALACSGEERSVSLKSNLSDESTGGDTSILPTRRRRIPTNPAFSPSEDR